MIGRLEKLVLGCVFLLVFAAIQYSRVEIRFFEEVFVREDGVLEWLGVLALLVGASLSFTRAWELQKERTKLFTLCLCILGGLFIFGAGEESSWGQRLFAVKSSQFFLEHNSQGETNLHNLVMGGVKINKLVFGLMLGIVIGLYFVVVPVTYRKWQKGREFINSWAVPVPRWQHLLAYALLALLVQLVASGKKGEVLEFGGCWIFVLLFYNPLNVDIYRRRY